MRLIDADWVLEHTKPYELSDEDWSVTGGTAIRLIHNAIDGAPTIDAVPVVRCRECKQGEIDDPDFSDQYYCHAGCGWNNGVFYCAYGERKEGADNG